MAFYLVTGGAGFIGSHMVKRLLMDGHRVRVVDDFSSGRKENLIFGPPVDTSHLEVIEGDLRDLDLIFRAAAGVEGIFHLGAVPSVNRSVKDPITTTDVNVIGTLNVLKAASDNGAGRVVFASSSSVYGGKADGRLLTEEEVGVPLSPYALSKKAGEEYMQLFSHLYGLKTVCIRYFNVFGPRQDPQGEYAAVIPRFITFALRGEALPIYGDGRQTRDFTYIDNVVAGTTLAMQAPIEGGEVINVAAGTPYSLLELVEALEGVLGRELEVVHLPPRPGDIRHSAANIALSGARLGYSPTVSFAQGLKDTVEAFRSTSSKAVAST